MPQYSYKLLPWLCNQLIEGNPITIPYLKCYENGRFTQLFVAHAALIQGFEMGRRPIIVIDSYHMIGLYKVRYF